MKHELSILRLCRGREKVQIVGSQGSQGNVFDILAKARPQSRYSKRICFHIRFEVNANGTMDLYRVHSTGNVVWLGSEDQLQNKDLI